MIRALVDGEVLQVNVRPGEFVGAPPSQALIVLGNVTQLHVRVDIDEYDIPRFVPDAPARATLKASRTISSRCSSCESSRTWCPRNRSPATTRSASTPACCK